MSPLQTHLPILHVLVPLLVAPLTAVLSDRQLAWAAATTASCFAFVLAAYALVIAGPEGAQSYALGGWQPPYGIELKLDAFSRLMLLIVTGASSAALLIARTGLNAEIETGRHHLYYTAWLLALTGLSGIVVSGDAFNIFVFMEISSLATYILIAGGPKRQALIAVFKYLVMGTIGATFYLIGVGLIYMMTGTLNLADMADRIGDVTETKPIFVAGAFITVGLALKAALFPLHSWLPNAYTFAPNPTTAFIAACSTKVALYILFQFDFLVLQGNVAGHATKFALFAVSLAIVAMLAGSLMALFQRDVKRLLAYSSVAQVGYIVFGAGLLSVTGLTGAVVHMFNHAIAKAALFIAVACIATRITSLSITDLSGVARRMPLTMAAFVIAGLSLIGIPGTAGFISKWYLLTGALGAGSFGIWLCVPLVVSSLLAMAYVWRVVEPAFFGKVTAKSPTGEAPWPMLIVLWVLTLGNVYFGLRPEVPLELAQQAAQTLLGDFGHGMMARVLW